jgi:hypothetical protein
MIVAVTKYWHLSSQVLHAQSVYMRVSGLLKIWWFLEDSEMFWNGLEGGSDKAHPTVT